MPETALVPTQSTEVANNSTRMAALPVIRFTDEQKLLIKKTVMVVASKNKDDNRGAITDDELAIFLNYCNRTGLDPVTGQIYGMKRYDKEKDEYKLVIQIGIAGFNIIALRNPNYDGQSAPQWCGPDGKWKDIWLEDTPPAAARVLVYHKKIAHPFVGIAIRKEVMCRYPNRFWTESSASQLAKCASARALRIAFPQDFSGISIHEELPAVDNWRPPVEQVSESVTDPIPPSDDKPCQPDPYYEEREKERMRKDITQYMRDHNIAADRVKKIAEGLGYKKPSVEMSGKELADILKVLAEGQQYEEAHPNENTTAEKLEPNPTANEPLPSEFQPPEVDPSYLAPAKSEQPAPVNSTPSPESVKKN